MRVLVATSATQGARASDSNECVEGELVWMVMSCRSGLRDPYGHCPGGRIFRGVSSDRDTTTAAVRDIPGLTEREVALAFMSTCDMAADDPRYPELMLSAILLTREVLAMASLFPAGQVVERRGNMVHQRKKARATVNR